MCASLPPDERVTRHRGLFCVSLFSCLACSCVCARVCEHKRENDVAVFFQPRPPIFVCARLLTSGRAFIHFYYFARFLISSREIKCAMSRIYITTDSFFFSFPPKTLFNFTRAIGSHVTGQLECRVKKKIEGE